MIFPTVQKKIDLSFWGNIHESTELHAVNEGAELDEEFSNIHYFENESGKNALKWIAAELSDDIRNLSITDEVGNVTKPIATKESDHIKLHLIPRYTLYGKWKSFWNI